MAIFVASCYSTRQFIPNIRSFPQFVHTLCITPLIKSSKQDIESLKSYRPVSDLSLISKVLETAVENQLTAHIDTITLLDAHQSAYRQGHRVETALQRDHLSVCQQLDRGRTGFLILLDLSAAFDTISHDHLISLLSSEFMVGGSVLRRIESYLNDRTFRVKINSQLSEPVPRDVGVPQGSVLFV